MVTVVLIAFFGVVVLALIAVAYSSNNRKRAGQAEIAKEASTKPVERRSDSPVS